MIEEEKAYLERELYIQLERKVKENETNDEKINKVEEILLSDYGMI